MGLRAKPSSTRYDRHLPHIQSSRNALFITFSTYNRWALPYPARDLVMKHCLYEHQRKVHLHGLVIMPDHVHLVLRQLDDPAGHTYSLAEIMQGIKGSSSRTVNRLLNRHGPVWQRESYDHVPRRNESLHEAVKYICLNPVRKGLVTREDEYLWLWQDQDM